MIETFSPARGVRRAQARQLLHAMRPTDGQLRRSREARFAFDAGSTGRRTSGWLAPNTSADAEVRSIFGTLRNRSRDLVRNNPYASRAVEVKVSETIGAGIVAEVEGNAALRSAWDRFVDECDFDGELDYYGLQSLCERARIESGEVLVQMVPAPRIEGSVAMKLRVLEPDFIDDGRDGMAPENGNEIRNGIEYDGFNRKVAYWLFDQHPGETFSVTSRGYTSRRVPASQIIHLYRRKRPGQTRGYTDLAPAILRLRELDEYDDAEVVRKRVEACLAGFVTSPQGAEAARIGATDTDDDGRLEDIYPGTIEYLGPGETITFSEPSAGGGYADFQRFQLRAICAGIGVPYELATWDLSQVNYSSYRAGMINFRRCVEQDQWQLYVPRLCRRVWRGFLSELALISNEKGVGQRTPVKWTPPRFDLIDPFKETKADVEAMLAGLEPPDEVIRRRGWTMTEVLEGFEKWTKELDRRGLSFSSDHRSASAAPPSDSGNPPPPDGGDDDDKEEAA